MDQWKKHPTHNSTKTWTSYREILCLIQASITMLDEAKPRKKDGVGGGESELKRHWIKKRTTDKLS